MNKIELTSLDDLRKGTLDELIAVVEHRKHNNYEYIRTLKKVQFDALQRIKNQFYDGISDKILLLIKNKVLETASKYIVLNLSDSFHSYAIPLYGFIEELNTTPDVFEEILRLFLKELNIDCYTHRFDSKEVLNADIFMELYI